MVFDCSCDLMKPELGPKAYADVHIAGAVYANLDTALSAKDDPTAASGGLLGHSDFAGNALDDFRALMWYSLAPVNRCVLQTANKGAEPYWVFAGPGSCPESQFREAVSLARTEGSPEIALTRVQAMIADLGRTQTQTPDLLLLQGVQQLLISFASVLQPAPTPAAPPPS